MLNNWTGDSLHIDSDIGRLDGYSKTWNLIVTERESGKSTLLWKKVYNAYKREQRPSLIFRRYQNDITETYLEDVENLIAKFTNQEVKLTYRKTELKSGGMTNIYLNDDK